MNQFQFNEVQLTTVHVDLRCHNLVINIQNGVIPGAGGGAGGGGGVVPGVGGVPGDAGVFGAGNLGCGGAGGFVPAAGVPADVNLGVGGGGAGGFVPAAGDVSALALILSAHTLVFNVQNMGVPVGGGPEGPGGAIGGGPGVLNGGPPIGGEPEGPIGGEPVPDMFLQEQLANLQQDNVQFDDVEPDEEANGNVSDDSVVEDPEEGN